MSVFQWHVHEAKDLVWWVALELVRMIAGLAVEELVLAGVSSKYGEILDRGQLQRV